jgi:threonine synthase
MIPNPKNATNFSYIKHLVCSDCGKEYSVDQIQTYCPNCQAALLARYDIDGIRRDFRREEFSVRSGGQWRWHELLPVKAQSNCVTLGEGNTPLLHLAQLGNILGLSNLFLKDESVNPTGSSKARGISVAISKAREFGIKEVIIPTAGSASGTVAAYAARAGLRAHIFMPNDAPSAYVEEGRKAGAEVVLVDGLISESVGMTGEDARIGSWFDLSAFKEPYRVEGKKIMGYEIAEAFKWNLPDVIIYPVGGGTGLVGMWKSFAELEALGWLENTKRPRLVAVQAKGCAPVVKAFRAKASFCDFWTNARTIATGLRVPKSFADHLILRDLYESQGTAVSVSDEAILSTQRQIEEWEGIFPALEGAATLAALIKLIQQKWIKPDERIVLLNTGSGSGAAAGSGT